MTVTATRLSDQPIIYPELDDRIGDNINGPAIIRMPDWAKGRLGTYHLYFSSHVGGYIRLAYADTLAGPWTTHRPGVFDVKDSLFEPVDPPEPPVSERPSWAKSLKGGYLYAHIASPDVHIDHEARTIVMYYHGLMRNGDQLTRLAVSTDGLSFTAQEPILGPPYFRAFQHGGFIYAIAWGGAIWRAKEWAGPFEKGPSVIPYQQTSDGAVGIRHGEVHCSGDVLHIFYSRMGDRPEAILHTQADISNDWMTWTAEPPALVLQPELDWEGADLELQTSAMGAAYEKLRELRDPCVFKDVDGKLYLLYCGGGESGIGIAELSGL